MRANHSAFPHDSKEEEGLTKRQYFSIKIYCALLSKKNQKFLTKENNIQTAKLAVDLADILIEEIDSVELSELPF
jgi:hypothetical protein